MRICSKNYYISPRIQCKQTPNFSSVMRKYPNLQTYDVDTTRTTSWMFRDLDWGDFVQLLNENFKDKDKVNIYSLAASDGSEAYTCAIALKECLPNKINKKFFPIIASDIDAESINVAKTGRINLSNNDIRAISKFVESKDLLRYLSNSGFHKYFSDRCPPLEIENNVTYGGVYSYKVSNQITQNVHFEQADMLDQIKKLDDDSNTVLLCKNVVPYLGKRKLLTLIHLMQEKLKPGSLVVFGEFDFNERMLDTILFTMDFERISHLIYKKK